MEYIFLINPQAGKNASALTAISRAKEACEKLGVKHSFHTLSSGDEVTNFVKKLSDDGNQYRIYGFGGDGTLNRIINGCVGAQNIEVGIVPLGTGNDFIKAMGAPADNYLDFKKQISSASRLCDVITYNGKYCLNMCNVGFDADVAMDMPAFKKLPGVSNHAAYYMALLYNFTKKMGRPMTVWADDEILYDGNTLMCAVGNGISCGGGFYVTSHAEVDDGLIDVSAVTPPAKYKLPGLIGYFTKGTQFESEACKPYIHFKRCKKVRIKADKPFRIVNDGEGEFLTDVTFEIIPEQIRFIVPQ